MLTIPPLSSSILFSSSHGSAMQFFDNTFACNLLSLLGLNVKSLIVVRERLRLSPTEHAGLQKFGRVDVDAL